MHASMVRLAGSDDAPSIARLLHDFNTEFGSPSPGATVLEARLRRLFDGGSTIAVLAGDPPLGLALLTLRPNVWYEGDVALLDELYVVPGRRGRGIGSALMDGIVETCSARGVDLIEVNVDGPDVDAQRFYIRHGFTSVEPDTGEPALYFHRELGGS